MSTDTGRDTLTKVVQILTSLFRSLLWIALAFCASTLVFAALSHRPLFADGASWYVRLLFTERPAYDLPHWRLFDIVNQLPALILVVLTKGTQSELAVRILDFTYSLHPLMSLGLTAAILRKHGRLALMAFPLLSFAVATLSTLPFSVSVVPTSLSVFWPLLFLAMYRRPGSMWGLGAVVFLIWAQTLTYETALLFLGLIALVSLWRARARGTRLAEEGVVLAACAIGAMLMFRIILLPNNESFRFWTALQDAYVPFLKWSIFLTLTFIGFNLGAALNPRRSGVYAAAMILFGVTGTAWYLALKHHPGAYVSLWDAINFRTTAIPLAGFLGLAAFSFEARGWKAVLETGWTRVASLVLVTLALFTGGMRDLANTQMWREGLERMRTYVDTPGCHPISREEFYDKLFLYGMTDWATPFVTLLLNPSHDVQTIRYVPADSDTHQGPCETIADWHLQLHPMWHYPIEHQRAFEMDNLVRQLRQERGY